MSLYDDFREDENATILIQSPGVMSEDPDTLQPVYGDPVDVYNNPGIYYELSAGEKVKRSQLQKSATGQIILDTARVVTNITEGMTIYVTTDILTSKEFEIVSAKNPLNKDDLTVVEIKEL